MLVRKTHRMNDSPISFALAKIFVRFHKMILALFSGLFQFPLILYNCSRCTSSLVQHLCSVHIFITFSLFLQFSYPSMVPSSKILLYPLKIIASKILLYPLKIIQKTLLYISKFNDDIFEYNHISFRVTIFEYTPTSFKGTLFEDTPFPLFPSSALLSCLPSNIYHQQPSFVLCTKRTLAIAPVLASVILLTTTLLLVVQFQFLQRILHFTNLSLTVFRTIPSSPIIIETIATLGKCIN